MLLNNFFILFFIFFIIEMIRQSWNNILWISASPEYEDFKKVPWFFSNGLTGLIVESKAYYTKMSYIWDYRIRTVWSNWRDFTSAVTSSLLLAAIFYWA